MLLPPDPTICLCRCAWWLVYCATRANNFFVITSLRVVCFWYSQNKALRVLCFERRTWLLLPCLWSTFLQNGILLYFRLYKPYRAKNLGHNLSCVSSLFFSQVIYFQAFPSLLMKMANNSIDWTMNERASTDGPKSTEY